MTPAVKREATNLSHFQSCSLKEHAVTHSKGPLSTPPSMPKPMATVGAGRLISMIWKDGDPQAGCRYWFNLFRTGARRGRISQLFQPADVIHLVKLSQVIASVIADDGCLSAVQRGVLKRLAADLDELWRRTTKTSENGDCSHIASDNHEPAPTKGSGNRDSTY